MIARSPTDLQPVLDTIAKSAAQVCTADDAGIRLVSRRDYDWRHIMAPFPYKTHYDRSIVTRLLAVRLSIVR